MSKLIKIFYQSKLIKQAPQYQPQNWQKISSIFYINETMFLFLSGIIEEKLITEI
ncbi:hypothetical protein Sta7437_3795 [Stanieria cyanosphaera PCC 7437]|uniref:Uncharacterized protein n=1 Tax=Stanieria cyanosphaera (strain ATCC 29371 / PCC 7437) TaxID=111780 RepID=K9Y014_STAC7|nr:hypothetical protein Sta7437_3795 [Stanieria cyanosphaera PCC 7437]